MKTDISLICTKKVETQPGIWIDEVVKTINCIGRDMQTELRQRTLNNQEVKGETLTKMYEIRDVLFHQTDDEIEIKSAIVNGKKMYIVGYEQNGNYVQLDMRDKQVVNPYF
jgi:hypothetical protein